uniref:G2/mitotic-specific cyclin-B3 n=2 Tax=Acrobeloides nanus TaxID=290746 RepID=A0A914CMG3_9BILA
MMDEPKPKRQALADLNSVLSNQLLIDSSKKPLELKKRSKRITASDEKLRQTTNDNENIYHDEVILPEVPTEDDPCPEVDFDKESESDPYAVSTYARDIFRYYKYRERFFKIGDYLKKQNHINRDHRAMLVDWMVGVQESFELNHETLYLAVKLVDMFLDHVPNVAKEDLQLLAGTSVFIAAKFDERSPPLIDDILYICEDAYSRDQLLQMERDVLCTIGFDLGMPLSYRFLRRYARVIKLDMPTLTLARYVLETSLMFYEFVHVSESLMAASSLLLALRMKHMGDWSLVLQKYSGLKLEEVEPLMYRLNHMIIKRSLNFDRLQIIYQKYCHEVFHSVAAMPSLESPIPITEPISAPPELGN